MDTNVTIRRTKSGHEADPQYFQYGLRQFLSARNNVEILISRASYWLDPVRDNRWPTKIMSISALGKCPFRFFWLLIYLLFLHTQVWHWKIILIIQLVPHACYFVSVNFISIVLDTLCPEICSSLCLLWLFILAMFMT